MILAEKIIKHRKQRGWSQEELAMQIGVSRQSVSKWESMSAFPDLDKIIKLSELFGVSTDYLLKDDMEEEPGFEPTDAVKENIADADKMKAVDVSLEEANAYMELAEKSAKKIALAVATCILSPISVILLGGYAEAGRISMTEDMAGGIGVGLLLLMVASAVFVFISVGIQLDKYEYLEKEVLNLQYGIAGIVEAKKEAHEPKYKMAMAIGVGLCIVSAIPLIIAAGFDFPDEVYTSLVVVLLIFNACGVYLFVSEGSIRSCYQKLLEEGEYTVEKKMYNTRNDRVSTIYWCIVTAVYLAYSFATMDWGRSWIIWPVAGILFVGVIEVADSLRKKFR